MPAEVVYWLSACLNLVATAPLLLHAYDARRHSSVLLAVENCCTRMLPAWMLDRIGHSLAEGRVTLAEASVAADLPIRASYFREVYELRGTAVGIPAMEKMHVCGLVVPGLPAFLILGFIRNGGAQAVVVVVLIALLGETLVFGFIRVFALRGPPKPRDLSYVFDLAVVGSVILHALFTHEAFGTADYHELFVVMAVMV